MAILTDLTTDEREALATFVLEQKPADLGIMQRLVDAGALHVQPIERGVTFHSEPGVERALARALLYPNGALPPTVVLQMGKALAALGKTQRWGLDSTNPELPEREREPNRDWLIREVRALREVAVTSSNATAIENGGPSARGYIPQTVAECMGYLAEEIGESLSADDATREAEVGDMLAACRLLLEALDRPAPSMPPTESPGLARAMAMLIKSANIARKQDDAAKIQWIVPELTQMAETLGRLVNDEAAVRSLDASKAKLSETFEQLIDELSEYLAAVGSDSRTKALRGCCIMTSFTLKALER